MSYQQFQKSVSYLLRTILPVLCKAESEKLISRFAIFDSGIFKPKNFQKGVLFSAKWGIFGVEVN